MKTLLVIFGIIYTFVISFLFVLFSEHIRFLVRTKGLKKTEDTLSFKNSGSVQKMIKQIFIKKKTN